VFTVYRLYKLITVYCVYPILATFAIMFAEEEWTDSPSADGASHTVKVSPAPCKVLLFLSLI